MLLTDEQVKLIYRVAGSAADLLDCNCGGDCEGTCTNAEALKVMALLNDQPSPHDACADQGLHVDTQALAELGPIGASIEAAETEHSEKLRKFAEQIARLHIAGEVRDLGDGTYSEYSPDGRSDEDAQALYRLIEDARELTGVQPDCLVDKRTLNQCDGCGEWFPLDKPECPVCGQEVR